MILQKILQMLSLLREEHMFFRAKSMQVESGPGCCCVSQCTGGCFSATQQKQRGALLTENTTKNIGGFKPNFIYLTSGKRKKLTPLPLKD